MRFIYVFSVEARIRVSETTAFKSINVNKEIANFFLIKA